VNPDIKNPKPKKLNFEATLTQLESLVDVLEHNDTSLEGSLGAFEEGIKLTRDAQKALVAAEQKVQVLLKKDGQIEVSTFDDGDIE